MAEQKPLTPFRYGTRQRFQDVGVIPFTSFGDAFNSQPFPRVGFMNKIYAQFRGSITIDTGGMAFANYGPWNLLKRIRGVINLGAATVFDLSGYGAYLVAAQLEAGARMDKAGVGDTTPDADIFSFAVTAGTRDIVISYILPVAANDNEQFSLGLINLQAPQVSFTLEGNWGSKADVDGSSPADQITTLTGNLHVGYMYFDVPNPMEVQLPPPMLCRTLEEKQPISSLGENIYTVPRQGLLLQLTHVVTLNNARSNSVDSFQFVINNTDFIYRYTRQFMKFQQRFNNVSEWPTGVFKYDFWAAQSGVSNGDTRDAIDTESNALTESRVVISSDATLGVANNELITIRRIFQQLT